MESLSLLNPLVINPVAILFFYLIALYSKLFLSQSTPFLPPTLNSIPPSTKGEGKTGRVSSSVVLESLGGGTELENTIPKAGQS